MPAGAGASGAAPDPAPARDPMPALPMGEQEENTGHVSQRKTQSSQRKLQMAPVQPGIICRMRSLLLHGNSSPLQMVLQAEPQPHCTQECGEMTGKGSGQAELLVTPADTNRRGTVGSVVHLRTSPENGTTSQEGPTGGTCRPYAPRPHAAEMPLCAGPSTTASGTQTWLYMSLQSKDITTTTSQTQPDTFKSWNSVTSPAWGRSPLTAASPSSC